MKNNNLNNLKKYLICTTSAAVMASSSAAIAAPNQARSALLAGIQQSTRKLDDGIVVEQTSDRKAKPESVQQEESKGAGVPAVEEDRPARPQNPALLGAIREAATLTSTNTTEATETKEGIETKQDETPTVGQNSELEKVNPKKDTQAQEKQGDSSARKKSLSAPSSAGQTSDAPNPQENTSAKTSSEKKPGRIRKTWNKSKKKAKKLVDRFSGRQSDASASDANQTAQEETKETIALNPPANKQAKIEQASSSSGLEAIEEKPKKKKRWYNRGGKKSSQSNSESGKEHTPSEDNFSANESDQLESKTLTLQTPPETIQTNTLESKDAGTPIIEDTSPDAKALELPVTSVIEESKIAETPVIEDAFSPDAKALELPETSGVIEESKIEHINDDVRRLGNAYELKIPKADKENKVRSFSKFVSNRTIPAIEEKKGKLWGTKTRTTQIPLRDEISQSNTPVSIVAKMESYRDENKPSDDTKRIFKFDEDFGDFSGDLNSATGNIAYASIDLQEANYDIHVFADAAIKSIGRNLDTGGDHIETQEQRSTKKKIVDKGKRLGRKVSSRISPKGVPEIFTKELNKSNIKILDRKDANSPIKLALGYNGEGDLTWLGDIENAGGEVKLIFNSNNFNPSMFASSDEVTDKQRNNDVLNQKTFLGKIKGLRQSDIIVNTDMYFAPESGETDIEPIYVKHFAIQKGKKAKTSRDIIITAEKDQNNIFIDKGAKLVLKQEENTNPIKLITPSIRSNGGDLIVGKKSAAIWQNIADDKAGQGISRTVKFDGAEGVIRLKKKSALDLIYIGAKDKSTDHFMINANIQAHPTSTLNLRPGTDLYFKGQFNADKKADENYAKIYLSEGSNIHLYDTVNAHITGDGTVQRGIVVDEKGEEIKEQPPLKISGIIENRFEMGDGHTILTSDLKTTNYVSIESDDDNRFIFDIQEHIYQNLGSFRVEGPGTFKIKIDKDKIGGIKTAEENLDPADTSADRKLVIDAQNLTESSYNIDPDGVFADLGCELDASCKLQIEAQNYVFDEENEFSFYKILQDEDIAPAQSAAPSPAAAAPAVQSKLGSAALDPRAIAQIISNSLKPIGTLSSAVGSRNLSLASTTAAIAAGDDAPQSGFIRKERGIWVTPFIGKATQKKFAGTDGYTSRSSGVTFGVDFDLTERASIGAAVGVMGTKFKYTGDRAGAEDKANTMLYSIYGNYDMPKGWFMQGMLSYGDTKVKYSDTRTLEPSGAQADISGEFKSKSYTGEFLFGRNINIKNKFVLTPIIGGKYTRFTEERQREYGQAEYTLSIKDRKISKTEIIAGMRASKLIRKGDLLITPEFDAIVNYRASENNSLLTATSNLDGSLIPSKAEQSSRTNVNLGAAVILQKGLFEFKVEYDAYLAAKYVGHQGALKLKLHL